MTERFARDVLLRSKWSNDSLDHISIIYISRGSEGGRDSLRGDEIEHIGRSFLELKDGGMIPFHRITGIQMDGKMVWSRKIRP